MYNSYASPTLINCSFISNSAATGGGTYKDDQFGSPRLIYCSFTANSASTGGDMYERGGTSSSLTGCVLFGNGANTLGGLKFNSSITANYCLFDNSVTGYSGSNNQTTTTSPFISSTDAQLNACSPAIDAGSNQAYSDVNGPSTDLAGNARIFPAYKSTIDIGAYEYQGARMQPLAITAPPVSTSSVLVGGRVSVPVSVSGSATAYQWYKDNLNSAVTGQTSATLTLSNVQTTDAGSYSLVISGSCNSVTSTAFSLSVTPIYPIRYVRQGASGSGSSWADASSDLQAMIDAVGVQQVWVAGGTYIPGGTANTDRSVSFRMKNGVALYGGFVGNETTLSQRPAIYPATGRPSSTTLSGDIGTVGDKNDNSYHVINNSELNNSASLDGFVVSGGNGIGNLANGGGDV